jgi:hypothetical protein
MPMSDKPDGKRWRWVAWAAFMLPLVHIVSVQAAGESDAVIIVEDKVYHEGWKMLSHLVVRSDGTYQLTVMPVWTKGKTVRGVVDKDLLISLRGVRPDWHDPRWHKTNGIPTFDHYVDDSKHVTPRPINALRLRAARNP